MTGVSTESIEKLDPSPLTRVAQRFDAWLIPRLPGMLRPNMVTWFGFGMLLLSGASFALVRFSAAWYAVAAAGVMLHWLADDLDGELARARNATSERGFFLDVYLDSIGAAAMCLGLAASVCRLPALPLLALALFLYGVILSLLHVLLRGVRPIGYPGPSEVQWGTVVLALLSCFHPGSILTLAGQPLTWFDAGLLASLAICGVEWLTTTIRFGRQLKGIGAS